MVAPDEAHTEVTVAKVFPGVGVPEHGGGGVNSYTCPAAGCGVKLVVFDVELAVGLTPVLFKDR